MGVNIGAVKPTSSWWPY